MSSPTRAPLPPLVGLIAVACAVLASTDSASASAETFTTVMYPGWNLIGWVEADAPVDRVFKDIPELQSVRSTSKGAAWVASRAQPDDASGGQVLRMGAGYWFRVNAERPLEWNRRFDPQAARPQLAPGHQLVSWAGIDGVPLPNAVNGIFAEVQQAWRWNPQTQRFQAWRPGGEVIEIPTPDPTGPPFRPSRAGGGTTMLSRGEAISVTVGGSADWRQPIGVLPAIEAVGEVSPKLLWQAERDLGWVVGYFGRKYGIEADGSRLRVLLINSAADLTGRPEDLTKQIEAAFTPPPSPDEVGTLLMPIDTWAPEIVDRVTGGAINGRLVMLHEYYHALQFQLAGPEFHAVPNWLIEAAPTWRQYQLDDAFDRSWRDEGVASQFVFSDGSIDAPAQHSAALKEAGWLHLPVSPPHAVGHTFMHWAGARFGADAGIRFWRTFQFDKADGLSWREVFEMAYGSSVERAQEAFAAWLLGRRPVVSGTIAAPERIDRTALYLNLTSGHPSPLLRIPITADGRFRVAVPRGDGYRFSLALADSSCAAYSGIDGILTGFDHAQPFSVGESGRKHVVIVIEDDYCQVMLEGRVATTVGVPVAGAQVQACAADLRCWSGTTDDAGRYRIQVVQHTDFTVMLTDEPGGCSLYVGNGGMVGEHGRASRFSVAAGASLSVDIQVAEPACGYRIHGRLLGVPSSELRGIRLGIFDNPLRVFARRASVGWVESQLVEVEADGSFELRVPSLGEYHLELQPKFHRHGDLQAHCLLQLDQPVRVSGETTGPIEWSVPRDFCKWQVSGLVTDAAGEPRPHFAVVACRRATTGLIRCGADGITDADGRFSLYVPFDGDFFLDARGTIEAWVPDYTRPWDSRAGHERCSASLPVEGHVYLQMNQQDIADVSFRWPYEECDISRDSVRQVSERE